MIAENPEDLWHAYNLIRKGDQITAPTWRRVQKESNTGSVDSDRKKITLTIEVLSVEYDPGAGSIRVGGTNIRENQFVRLGSYHTIELAIQRKFTLAKHEWDSLAIERLNTACDPTKTADLAAVLMHQGLANLCIVTPNTTLVQSRIQTNIPRKRKGASGYDKGIVKFYEAVLDSITRTFNFDVLKCILIASPGFTKDEFFDYMMKEAVKRDIKVILENKTKFMKVDSHSGNKRALREILADTEVTKKLEEVKAAGEVNALNRFYEILREDSYRAVYSYKHVSIANENQAIESLLISEDLFRSFELEERKKYVKLVEEVRENGGEVYIFSSLHVSGEQLNQLTGIAAILRFPLLDIDELEDSEDDFDDSSYVEEYTPI